MNFVINLDRRICILGEGNFLGSIRYFWDGVDIFLSKLFFLYNLEGFSFYLVSKVNIKNIGITWEIGILFLIIYVYVYCEICRGE